jgi:hypothetical protein
VSARIWGTIDESMLRLLVACDGSDRMKTESGGGELASTVHRTGWNEIWLMGADAIASTPDRVTIEWRQR